MQHAKIDSIKMKRRSVFSTFFFCLLLCFPAYLLAAPPSSFNAAYDANFQGLKAKAEMSLQVLDNEIFELRSTVDLEILGKSLASIDEKSLFLWQDEQALPQTYSFIQEGLGSRSRSIEFDWKNKSAKTIVDDAETTLNLNQNLLDDLSMYTSLKQQVANNNKNIFIDQIDKNVIKQYHYRIVGEEQLKTPLGNFNAIKVERVREAGNQRKTELWLAKDWGFLLLKLYQEDKDDKIFQINLRKAYLDGKLVTSLNN